VENCFSRTRIGIDWNMFCKDTKDMCDAAISRDPAGKTSGPRTVGHTARKLQDKIETFYARVSK